MLRAFSIHAADSLTDAAELKAELGDDAQYYAGGTELLVLLKQRIGHFPHLIDIKHIPGLSGLALTADGTHLLIGAGTTHRAIETSPLVQQHLPLLAAVERHVANIRVRTVGTIGGNLCFAEPHSDLAAACILLDAVLTLTEGEVTRQVPAAEFVTGAFETVRRPGELLTAIAFPVPPAGSAGAYLKYEFHVRPSVTAGVWLAAAAGSIRQARVVVGCAGPRPVRIVAAEAALHGLPIERAPAALAAVAAAAQRDCGAEADFTGSAEFKAHLAGVYAGRALQAALQRLQEGVAA